MDKCALNKINEHQNDIGRFLIQLKSTLVAISIEENLDTLNMECIQNVLWLAQDRIADIEKSNEAQYQIIKRELSTNKKMLFGEGVEAFQFNSEE